MTRYRITVRGDNIELRGWLDSDEKHGQLVRLATAVEAFGILVASKAEDDYNPFRAIVPGQEEWIETINHPDTTPEEAEAMTKHAVAVIQAAHEAMNGHIQAGAVQRSE